MQYCHVPSIQSATQALSQHLANKLAAGHKILWLVSGGSNVAAVVQISTSLADDVRNVLTIALVDERYGSVGHSDSNWQQLLDAGLPVDRLQTLPVLTAATDTMVDAAADYQHRLEQAYADNDYVIGLYGMGGDGHIAGILPNSPAVDATGLVTSYVTEQYERITTTFTAIKRCDSAFLFCFGETKQAALQLLQQDIPLAEQPAQILKQLPEVYVYNDQIGETI